MVDVGAVTVGNVAEGPALRTERLVLRRWLDEDLEPFAALNADPVVMELLGPRLTRDQSDAYVARVETGFAERGYGLWAVEVPGTAPFVGFVGLNLATIDAPFAPAVEVGWRLARQHWGHGYATEGAAAALAFAFDTLDLVEVVSFTARANARSQRVMERLGMRRDRSGDFEHPDVPEGDRLRPHVLYRCDPAWWDRDAWREAGRC